MDKKISSQAAFPIVRSDNERIEATGLTKIELISAMIAGQLLADEFKHNHQLDPQPVVDFAINIAKELLMSVATDATLIELEKDM